jgi:uncharacterized protein
MFAAQLRSALARLILATATVLSMVAQPATPAAVAVSTDVVISQVYGGGGNTGATLNNDFVEIFNRGTSPVDMTGWSVQYASAAGTSWQRTDLSGVLQPGRYYLIQEAAGAGGTTSLPPPDASGGITMSATTGKVALVTNRTLLTCGGTIPCFPNAAIRDFVGYGSSATTFEGSGPTPTLTNTTAAVRADLGCAETDVNAADFASAGPSPRNTASQAHVCGADPAPLVEPAVRIREIQGTAHISTFNARRASNVPGVVTGLRSNGFYLQDPNPDADEATSEGIFVFTSSAPSVAVGDSITLNGTVTEFRPGGATNANLTITELVSPAITLVSRGNSLPAPIVIGQGGRLPPTSIIDDDTSGSVETGGVFDPANDGIDFYESLEGMLVRVNDPVVVGPTNSFNEIPVLGDNGANASLRTARGGIIARKADFNPERIIVDDEVLKVNGRTIPTVNVRDTFNGFVEGVLDYDFGNFRIQLTAAPTVTAHNLPKETTPSGIPNQLKVATFNVENLDPGDGPTKFNALAGLIVRNLRAPDLVALEEVQDSNGATNDGTVEPSQTMNMLIAAIQAAGGPRYDYRQINPVNNQDGGEPGGNIRVVFLFRSDRGLSFVDRPGGGSTNAVGVVGGPTGPQLTFSPGRIDPTNSAFTNSRKPLAGEFRYNGHRLFLIANHFNSKGGDNPLFGRFQPPVAITEVQRHQQAHIVHDFVASILGLDPDANVIVLGDLNDFDFSQTLSIVKAGVLHNLMESLPPNERYTYDFQGNSQALDYILASNHLVQTASPQYDIVHVNSEFADNASDHEPQLTRFTLPSFDSVCALARLYSASPSVADSLCTDLATAASAPDDAGKHAALDHFAATVRAETGRALDSNEAPILLQLINYL